MSVNLEKSILEKIFTFQYGQIYYIFIFQIYSIITSIYIPIWLDLLLTFCFIYTLSSVIYIPIWLDLLYIMTKTIINYYVYLHSNMVRFIIDNQLSQQITDIQIYIPIWLDLLFQIIKRLFFFRTHLHSNMVRFIIKQSVKPMLVYQLIYIPIWLDLLLVACKVIPLSLDSFTFQYGQIYYTSSFRFHHILRLDLHSNMVRFIIIHKMTVYRWLKKFTFQYGQIYYSLQTSLKLFFTSYLHSNMVRFIMKFYFIKKRGLKKFTFQYGQIYYLNSTSKSNREFRIYIPIWLDLLSYIK